MIFLLYKIENNRYSDLEKVAITLVIDEMLDNFRDLLREKFGTVLIVSSSSASRQVGLVFGHIVNERIRNIEQYDHSADFTFTELDMMISNGYPSWFWEDRGAGGYALRGGFLRIKTMFKYLAISAWEKVTDSVKRQKIEQSIQANLLESDLQTDIKVIRAAVAKKIELDALESALSARLKQKNLHGKLFYLFTEILLQGFETL